MALFQTLTILFAMAHNHPTPSKADIEMTREVQKAGQSMSPCTTTSSSAEPGHTSLKSLGLF
jgi:DNA repair protein RadC